jgi:WD40 repeat protein
VIQLSAPTADPSYSAHCCPQKISMCTFCARLLLYFLLQLQTPFTRARARTHTHTHTHSLTHSLAHSLTHTLTHSLSLSPCYCSWPLSYQVHVEKAVATIESKANVCCVKFNPESANHIAFGSADHNIHYYDLRCPLDHTLFIPPHPLDRTFLTAPS